MDLIVRRFVDYHTYLHCRYDWHNDQLYRTTSNLVRGSSHSLTCDYNHFSTFEELVRPDSVDAANQEGEKRSKMKKLKLPPDATLAGSKWQPKSGQAPFDIDILGLKSRVEV